MFQSLLFLIAFAAAVAPEWQVAYIGTPTAHKIAGASVAHFGKLEGFNAGDVSISGPWHNGRHVWYATLNNPNAKQIEEALTKAKQEWASAKAVKPVAVPFDQVVPRNADGSSRLPVGSTEALDEVNAARAKRGLKPFIRDDGLTVGAGAMAAHLAARHMSNHTSNDFAFLPSGSTATAGGLGVATPDWGWISCCYLGPYTYGGAAWVMGSDGQRYMYLFVR